MEKTAILSDASACSKVLITGAYLIIDPIYSGLVIATDARFHTRCSIEDIESTNEAFKIKVTSRQFKVDMTFNYDN